MLNSKIMVVDDEIKACQLLSKFLSSNGFSVQIASNGQEALIKAVEFKPNCILLDVRMPQGGVKLLTSLREELPDTIIFMVSAIIEANHEFLEKGAHSCIEKPVNMGALLSTIRQALNI
jgi:two-component system, NtrC family, nitrogen regulation response regulator NtrX